MQYSQEGNTPKLNLQKWGIHPTTAQVLTHKPMHSRLEDFGVLIPNLLKCSCSEANHVKKEWNVSNDLKGNHEEMGLNRAFLDYFRKFMGPRMTSSLAATAIQN